MLLLFLVQLSILIPLAFTVDGDDNEIYDYIVVGAGSAGAIIASRLAEDEDVTVLLLEAGGEPSFVSTVPLVAYKAMQSEVDWKFFSTPQKHCCDLNKEIPLNRGKMLGGSSSLNWMIYTRGHQKDYDSWAALGNEGWSYDEVLPYFKKLEDYQIPTTPESEAFHNIGGPITVSHPTFKTPIADAFLSAGQELGYDLVDYNTNVSVGFQYDPVNIRNGVRCSTNVGYIQPATKKYKNLTVLSNAFVTRLNIDESQRVTGVEYEKDGSTLTADVNIEVILSAGAIQSPQLLMVSGIGPREELEKFNIPVILDLPGVGKNLQDHIVTGQIYNVAKKNTTCNSVRYETRKYLNQWKQDGSGPMSVPISGEGLAFLESKYLPEEEKGWPDYEIFLISDSIYKVLQQVVGTQSLLKHALLNFIPHEEDAITMFAVLLRPKSRGTVTLQSRDPHDHPLIDPNYLADERDLDVLVESLKTVHKLGATDAFSEYGLTPFNIPVPSCFLIFDQDDRLRCQARNVANTVWHYTSTCAMGPATNPLAVVDNELRVYGMKNLRVADASIMPLLVAAHTNAPSMMIGEKAADLIKRSRVGNE